MSGGHVLVVRSDVFDEVARESGALGLAIYLYLCRRADSDGRCWPSYNRIASDLLLSRSSVIRYTNRLIETGYLAKDRRGDGKNTESNAWLVAKGGVTETLPSVTQTPPPVSQGHPPGVTETPKVNTVKKKYTRSSGDAPGFDRFWAEYPRRMGKAEARRMWDLMDLESMADQIVAAVIAQKAASRFSSDPKYILYPVRWLERRRFDDEVVAEQASANRRDGGFLAG
jgi:hypothetical protein